MRPIQVADIPNMGLIIWDGQHTAAAARMANNNQDLMVPCIVNRMSYEEAAELVAKQEENKAKLHIVEQFRSSVESGDVDDENIAKLLKQHGITLSKRYSENSTAAVNALRQVYADSYHNLDVTLSIIEKAWPGDEDRWRTEIIRGIGVIVQEFSGQFKVNDMVERICKKPVNYYISNARYGGPNRSQVAKIAELFIVEYNRKRTSKYRLDTDKLK